MAHATEPPPPPFIDEIGLDVPRARDEVWPAVDRAATALCRPRRTVIDGLLGTTDPGGFRVHRRDPPECIELRGSHRFSRYRLELLLQDSGPSGTTLSARSYGSFSGIHGRLYRLAVIGTGLHVVATRRLLQRMVRE